MKDESSRNTIIFLVCALVLFVLYNQFVLGPQQKAAEAARKAHPPVETQTLTGQTLAPGAPALSAPPAITRAAALATSPRVPIVTPALKGSISLRGARLDDLFLTQYAQTTAKNSPPVEMLRPYHSHCKGVALAFFLWLRMICLTSVLYTEERSKQSTSELTGIDGHDTLDGKQAGGRITDRANG